MRKKVLTMLVAMSAALALGACGGGGGGGTTQGGSSPETSQAAGESAAGEKILTVELGPDVETIDPALNTAVDGGNYILFAFSNLLASDKEGNAIPALAERYEKSTDGLTWTFHLRDGLKWSDGTDFKASDFVYSWQRLVDPDTAAPYAQTVLGMVAGYEEAIGNPDEKGDATTEPDPTKLQVEAPDDKTLVVHMATPCPYFDKLAFFPSLMPVNKASVEADPDGWAVKPESYISTGPFYLAEWVPGSYLLYKKNPYYWDKDKVKLDGIKCLLMEDKNAAFSAFESGDALMIKDIPTEEITTLQQRPDYHLDPNFGTYYLTMNLELDTFKDARVRQALSLALDRKYISETITAGTYAPGSHFVPAGVSDWDGTSFKDNPVNAAVFISESPNKEDDFQDNVEKAKTLMEAAGFPGGAGFPTITYTTNDAGYHKRIAEYLQQAWKEIGINVEVNIVEWKSFLPQRRAGDFQMCRNGWVLDYNDPSNILECLKTGNGNNNGKYNNPEFDALLDKAAAENDPQARYKLLHEAEELALEEQAMIPLLYYNDPYLQSDKIVNSWHTPDGFWHFEYADLTQ